MCNLTTDYIDDLMVRMAHHSTAIEGNSLTHGETKSILIDNYLPRAMDMREMYEVLNYKNLIPFLVESIQGKVPISPEFCKKIHSIICNNAIEGTPGEFKKIPNYVIGADWEPSPPYRVLTDLQNWCLDTQYQIKHATCKEDIVSAICRQHIRFERIHPFSDGNGRVGRALMIYSCFENHLAPIVIPVNCKKQYIALLNNSDETSFTAFALELQQEEYRRIKQICGGEKINLIINKSSNKKQSYDLGR